MLALLLIGCFYIFMCAIKHKKLGPDIGGGGGGWGVLACAHAAMVSTGLGQMVTPVTLSTLKSEICIICQHLLKAELALLGQCTSCK